jgi:hypothetical protein
MRRKIALAFFVLLTPFITQAADPPLFHLAIADVPVENGKLLNMEFQEVARAPEPGKGFTIAQCELLRY